MKTSELNGDTAQRIPDLDDIFAVVDERSAARRRRAGYVASTAGVVAVAALGIGLVASDNSGTDIANPSPEGGTSATATTPVAAAPIVAAPDTLAELDGFSGWVAEGRTLQSQESLESLARLWGTDSEAAAAVVGLASTQDRIALDSFARVTDERAAHIATFDESAFADDAAELAMLWGLEDTATIRAVAGNKLTGDDGIDRELLFGLDPNYPETLAGLFFDYAYTFEQAEALSLAWDLETPCEAKSSLIGTTFEIRSAPEGVPPLLTELTIQVEGQATAMAAGWDELAVDEVGARWGVSNELAWIFLGFDAAG